MYIFLDSADVEEIRKANDTGLLDGVTTNPTLAAKNDKPYHDVIKEILGILDKGSVLNIEVIATDIKGMIEEGRKLSKMDKRVVVKIPCTENGLKACQTLSKEGVSVNMTLIFSATQALLAAKAGAVFASAFVGRLEDKEPGSGLELVSDMVTIYDNYNFDTAVLFASVRSIEHVSLAALLGVDIITVPYKIFSEMGEHKMTEMGLAKFLDDWKNSGLSLPV